MAKTYRISVSIQDEATGQEVLGAPLTHRMTCDEATGPMHYEKASGGGYTAAPTSLLDEVQLLLMRVTKAMTLRLDGQSDAGIPLVAGGFVLLVGADLDAGPSTNVTHDNSSNETAVVDAFAAGT